MLYLSASNVNFYAKRMGLDLSDDQCQRLVDFGKLLLKWNAVYSLTSVTSEEDILKRHLLDSLSFVSAISKRKIHRILDAGSGGGLPAIPLAVVRPDIQVVMSDSKKKKTAFLQQVCLSLGLANAEVVHGRVEELMLGSFDAISCRAFSSLARTVSLTSRHLRKGGVWLMMKGKDPVDEIRELPKEIVVIDNEKLIIPDSDFERHLIVLMEKT